MTAFIRKAIGVFNTSLNLMFARQEERTAEAAKFREFVLRQTVKRSVNSLFYRILSYAVVFGIFQRFKNALLSSR